MVKTINTKECIRILKNNYIGYLSYLVLRIPYVVPITYFYDKNDNTLVFYSAEGQKIKAMRTNPNVSMSVTEINAINNWNSVSVRGVFEELEGVSAKAKLHDFSLGIKDLIRIKEHKKMSFLNEFSSKMFDQKSSIIFIIKNLEITGLKRG